MKTLRFRVLAVLCLLTTGRRVATATGYRDHHSVNYTTKATPGRRSKRGADRSRSA